MFQGFNLLARASAMENVELPLLYTGTARRRAAGAGPAPSSRRSGSATGPTTSRTSSPAASSSAWPSPAPWSIAPSLLLADEPTGNLDSRTSVEIMALLQALNAAGITIVLVTHEPDIARYAGRVLHFRDGRLQRDEPVRDRGDARRELAALAPAEPEEVAA